jgi:hypothetical protein
MKGKHEESKTFGEKERNNEKKKKLADTQYGKELSEFLVAVNNDSAFFWDVTLCGVLKCY